jgi:thermostable 8-oxoguanine DNA glycosylase
MNQKFIKQENEATQELRKVGRRFKPRRKTTLVRIQRKWLVPLKIKSRGKKKTISKLHDEIYPFYFKHQSDDG